MLKHILSPDEGRHFCASIVCGIVFVVFIPLGHLLVWVSAAPTELNLLLSVFTQGSISGFALISPWAMQECRPYRAHCRIGRLRSCVVVLCSLNVLGCVNELLCSGNESQRDDTPA